MDPVDSNNLKTLIDVVAQVGIIPGVLLWTMLRIEKALHNLSGDVKELNINIKILLDRSLRGRA